MTTLLKKPRRARRTRDLDATRAQTPARFDPAPPVEPPDCLKNRAGDAKLSDEEYIEALEWLQACIRSIVITDKGAQ